MTCRDVMTPDPACCQPGDTTAQAARLMREKNIGSVPVVTDQESKRLVGMVTDRDLALQVVAEGRDPRQVQVREAMSTDLVTCRAEDDYSRALETMARNQIRRIPVLDEDGLLIGIIAQADVARRSEAEKIGEMVEEISQPPRGSGMMNFRRWGGGGSGDRSSAATHTALIAGAAGLGAGLMYFFAPSRHGKGSGKTGEEERQQQQQQQPLFTAAGHPFEREQSRSGAAARMALGGIGDKSSAARIAFSIAGGGLVYYGLRNRSKVGQLATTAGLGLLARGILNRDIGWSQPAKLAGMLRG
jgi:CBS domain-containing protein